MARKRSAALRPAEMFTVVIQLGASPRRDSVVSPALSPVHFQMPAIPPCATIWRRSRGVFHHRAGGFAVTRAHWDLERTPGPSPWRCSPAGFCFSRWNTGCAQAPQRCGGDGTSPFAVGMGQIIAAVFSRAPRARERTILLALILGLNRPLATEFRFSSAFRR